MTDKQVRSGQAISAVARVLGIPKVSLSNWVRLAKQGDLGGSAGEAKARRRIDIPQRPRKPVLQR